MKRIATLLLALFCAPLFAIEDELRQVRSLAEHGQFGAVEVLCQEVFAKPDTAEIDKIRLATELVRARSLQLLTVEPAQRDRIVRGLESLESTWLTGSTDTAAPDLALARITLRLQLAMTYQSLGDYQRLEGDVVSATNQPAAYQRARSTLHDAIERLKLCQRELQSLRQRIGINVDSFWRQRLLALEYSTTMQLGIAQKSLALTFTTEESRNFELRQAAETLSELASINSTDPIIVQCKVVRATCHRLAGELERCAEILTQLRSAALTTIECRLRTEAEWLRYHIATGNSTTIAEMRRQYAADRADSRLHPDFDLARLELFLLNDPARNIRPEHAAATRLQQTTSRELGTYWGRRAGMTASMMPAGSTDLVSAEMLATLGETRFQEKQFVESAQYYEQAAARADANRNAEDMYRFNRLAIRSWAQALEHLPPDVSKTEYQNRLIALLRQLSLQNPNHPDAWGLHLSALRLQEQLVSTQPELTGDYLALMKEHMNTWTESPALPTLRRLSIILLERKGRIDEAAALLPLLDLEQLGALPAEIQRLRVRQLDAEGKTQDAIEILTTLLGQRREPATLQLFAEILTRQTDAKNLNDALTYWRELERGTARNSETWWEAWEGTFEVLFKLNRQDEAKQPFEMLRILYPQLGGAERKERLMRLFEGQ